MTFQFLCPQGHLLQGEEAHMGMQCQCPQCGVAFIIPTIQQAPAPVAPVTVPVQRRPSDSDSLGLAPLDEPDPIAQVPTKGFSFPGADAEEPSSERAPRTIDVSEFASEDLDDSVGEALLHIPCPNGHELDVPLDYLGAKAACPHCGAQFRLKREKSLEYLREQEIIDRKRAQFWFRLAIVAGGMVVMMVLIMIIATLVS